MESTNFKTLFLMAAALILVQACSLPAMQATEVAPTEVPATSNTEESPIEVPVTGGTVAAY